MLFAEGLQVLAHDVILPDLLVDDEECGVDGQYGSEDDHGQFNVHRVPSQGTTGIRADGKNAGTG